MARDVGLGLPEGAADELITFGFLLSIVWAAWLGFELGRTPGPSSPAEPGRPIPPPNMRTCAASGVDAPGHFCSS